MSSYSLPHLSNTALLRGCESLDRRAREDLARFISCVAEVDTRRLYVAMGYPSMFEFRVRGLRLDEDTARESIEAAHAARRFPAIHPMLADGRLDRASVVLLAPYLAPDNAEDLLAAASHRTEAQIERLLAERFPRPDPPMTAGPHDGVLSE